MIDDPAFALQKHVNAPIAVAHRASAISLMRLRNASLNFIANRFAIEARCSARTTLADLIAFFEVADQDAPPGRPYHFFLSV